MLQLVLAMGGQGQIGWAATSMLPPAALGLAGASWRTDNRKKLTTAWRSKQHCRYSVSHLETLKYTINYPTSSVLSLGWTFITSTIKIYSPLYIKSTALPLFDETISVVCQIYIKLYKSIYKTFATKLILKKIRKNCNRKTGDSVIKKIALECSQSREFEYNMHDFVSSC